MEVALKIVGVQLDAFQLTWVRFMIGGLFLLPFAIWEIKKYKTVITKKDFIYMALMGIVNICISMIFFQLGVIHSKASTAAVIFCMNPMFTLIFAHFITEEKLNRNKIIALVFGLLGIVSMINPFHIEPGNTLIGAGYSTLAALFFGLYSAMGRITIKRLRGLTQTSISFLIGSVFMFPILLFLDRPIFEGINTGNIGLVFYVGIIVTGIGYLLYFLAMEASDAATASIVFFVKPALAPIIAVIILHEAVGLNGIIGILLIFIGSYINLRQQMKKKIAEPEGETVDEENNNQ